MTPKHAVAAVALSLLAGCAADDFAAGAQFPEQEGGAPCPAGQLNLPTGCAEPPDQVRDAVCPFVATHLPGCVDADGDCFVSADCVCFVTADCAFPPALAPYADRLVDCDDTRPAVRPDAAEACNGLDDDCDGLTDEAFADIGARCDACGVEGKLECAVDPLGDEVLACSTAPGQSSPAEFPAELCDGLDSDCDGQVDEGCRLEGPPPGVTGLADCGPDALVVTAAGGVFQLTRGDEGWGQARLSADDARPAHHPVCLGEQAAWLEGGDCTQPGDGPARCTGASVVRATPEGPVDLTGGTAAGGLHLDPEGGLWWHVVIDGLPRLVRHQAGQVGLDRPEPELALSDPVPVADGVVARQWVGGTPAGAWLPDGPDPDLGEQPGRAGPPAASARWLAWPYDDGAGLWVVDLQRMPLFGFQPTSGPGPSRQVALRGDRLVWLDVSRGALMTLDLLSGVSAALAEGLPADPLWAVGPDTVTWIDADGALRRQPLP